MKLNKYIFLLVSVIGINMIVLLVTFYIKSQLVQEHSQMKVLQQEAFAFSNLSKQYSDDTTINSYLKKLKEISFPLIKTKNRTLVSYRYQELSPEDSDRVLSLLLNSSLQIKNLSIEKDDNKTIKLYLEVSR